SAPCNLAPIVSMDCSMPAEQPSKVGIVPRPGAITARFSKQRTMARARSGRRLRKPRRAWARPAPEWAWVVIGPHLEGVIYARIRSQLLTRDLVAACNSGRARFRYQALPR